MGTSRNSGEIRAELLVAIEENHKFQRISRMGALTNVESRQYQELNERIAGLYKELRVAANINKQTPGMLLSRIEMAKDEKVLRLAELAL